MTQTAERPLSPERRDELLNLIFAAKLAAMVKGERPRHELRDGRAAAMQTSTGPSKSCITLLLAIHNAGGSMVCSALDRERLGLTRDMLNRAVLSVEKRSFAVVTRHAPGTVACYGSNARGLTITEKGTVELRSRGLIL